MKQPTPILVESVLRELTQSEQKIYYYPNAGNAGDALINVGFYQLAEKVGLTYEIATDQWLEHPRANAILIFAGGGGLVPEGGWTNKLTKALANKTYQVIILPNSLRHASALIEKLDEKDIVFCRERISYAEVEQYGAKCKVLLDHDMALAVDVTSLLARTTPRPALTAYNAIRYALVAYHMVRAKITGRLPAFRCDIEANKDHQVPRSRFNDLSPIAKFASGDYEGSFYSAKKLLQLVNLYDEIHTDRLHVLISAALLKKKVTGYPNSYYKVTAVYEMSLKGIPEAAVETNERKN